MNVFVKNDKYLYHEKITLNLIVQKIYYEKF